MSPDKTQSDCSKVDVTNEELFTAWIGIDSRGLPVSVGVYCRYINASDYTSSSFQISSSSSGKGISARHACNATSED